ncbi:MAG: TIGR02391 family protein [Rhodanobacteraceae bacterium]
MTALDSTRLSKYGSGKIVEGVYESVPDVDVLLGLAPEELAQILLRSAKKNLQNKMVRIETATRELYPSPGRNNGYPYQRRDDIHVAIAEAWNWLQVNSLIVPASEPNGRNGWFVISRRGAAITSQAEFQTFRDAVDFPKSLLHPQFADKVWLSLARGDRDIAVFTAFKAVEEAVREAAGLLLTDIGAPMMRKAFAVNNGPLTDMSHPEGEREALAHLFAGAIGSYKNPHSHRTVVITDAREAQEMVMLTSHLLRIVDARKVKR